VINFILIITIGRYLLSSMLYPYQNSIIREGLDRNNASRFGQEFSHYLECMVYTIRIQAGMDLGDAEERKNVR
jgi:hypothetical protein